MYTRLLINKSIGFLKEAKAGTLVKEFEVAEQGNFELGVVYTNTSEDIFFITCTSEDRNKCLLLLEEVFGLHVAGNLLVKFTSTGSNYLKCELVDSVDYNKSLLKHEYELKKLGFCY